MPSPRSLLAAVQGSLTSTLALCLLIGMGRAVSASAAPPLRICADPDDLPFTSSVAATPGLYLELAQHIAAQLGRTLEPIWAKTYEPERMLRAKLLTQLLTHQCDLFVGVPSGVGFMAPSVVLSHPLLDVGYALVTPPGSVIASLADLSGRPVAVEFGSPAQDLLARRGDVTTLTVTATEDGMRAVEQHRADAALLWGPSAGYYNQIALHGSERIVPITGKDVHWGAAIAFAASDTALRDEVNAVLARDSSLIARRAARYGFTPAAGSDVMEAAAVNDPDVAPLQIPTITKDTTDATPAPAPAAAPPPAAAASGATPASGLDGHIIFNGTCAACHGPDAVQAERRINLRLLHARYGDTMDSVFLTTVTDGRPSKGMPSWKGAFTDAELGAILAYLHSVQEQ